MAERSYSGFGLVELVATHNPTTDPKCQTVGRKPYRTSRQPLGFGLCSIHPKGAEVTVVVEGHHAVLFECLFSFSACIYVCVIDVNMYACMYMCLYINPKPDLYLYNVL